jgi:hypothetical protein
MRKTDAISPLIHENFSIVMAFAFSQPSIRTLLDNRFHGRWRYLRRSLHGLAETRADRALLELAIQVRALDDAAGLSHSLPFGKVTQSDGSATELYLRDMTNKIMHASRFEWVFTDPEIQPWYAIRSTQIVGDELTSIS